MTQKSQKSAALLRKYAVLMRFQKLCAPHTKTIAHRILKDCLIPPENLNISAFYSQETTEEWKRGPQVVRGVRPLCAS